MENWHSVVIPIAAVVLGFFLGILRQKLFEKKVNISHKLDAPAVFSAIPPTVSFQNLKITNSGKLPAKNLRVNLRNALIEQYEVIYKPITEEQYKEETREGILSLKFETLLPEEELLISFKSSKPIPDQFLINIKSDEMLSKEEAGQKGSSQDVIKYITAGIAAGLSVTLVLGILTTKWTSQTQTVTVLKPAEQPALSLSIIKDKSIYARGDKAEITYQITNLKKDALSGIWGILEIPGFELNNRQKYMQSPWLESEGEITHRVTFNIPRDVPAGKHKVIVKVGAISVNDAGHFEQKTEAFFEVQ